MCGMLRVQDEDDTQYVSGSPHGSGSLTCREEGHDWRLLSLVFTPSSKQRNIHWSSGDDDMWLLTPDELKWLPEGVELRCIAGDTVIKGRDYIDLDTRGGFISFGITDQELSILAERDPKWTAEQQQAFKDAEANLRNIQAKWSHN